jgi:hypothetical protein
MDKKEWTVLEYMFNKQEFKDLAGLVWTRRVNRLGSSEQAMILRFKKMWGISALAKR